MRRLTIIVLTATLATAWVGGSCQPRAWAEPLANVQRSYYTVDGLTAAQIRQALDRNTPVRQNGKPFDAHTRWNVDWQFSWNAGSDGSCRITSVSTTVRIRYTLPRLTARARRPREVEDRWEEYVTALVAHEKTHAAFGLDAAREIEQQLPQLDGRTFCQQLASDANDLARAIIARYARMEDRYDARTNHGAAEGARFP